jgi:hypothetical protein
MPLRYLVDENLRGPFWTAFVRANAGHALPLEIACVGECNAPPLASRDSDILKWSEQHGYLVVSNDVKTMPGLVDAHLRAGGHLPGVFLVNLPCSIPYVLEALLYYGTESDEEEWHDQCTHIP